MYHCNPTAGEKYYLRLLLTVVRGPQSFEHLCTVNDVVYPTYCEACMAMELTDGDQKWIDTFTEAIVFASRESLQWLLVTALIQKGLADPLALWERFRKHFCNDLGQEAPRRQRYNAPLMELKDLQTNLGLFLLDQILMDNQYTLSDFNLPQYQHEWREPENNQLIVNELNYDIYEQEQLRIERYNQLNNDQKLAFDTVIAAITDDPQHAHFFLKVQVEPAKHFFTQHFVIIIVHKERLYYVWLSLELLLSYCQEDKLHILGF